MQVVLFASVVLVLLPLFLAKVFILDTLHSSMSSEVDENLQRLAGMKGAIGGLVMTMEGEMIRSTLDTSTTSTVSDLMISLVSLAKYKLKCSDNEQGNDLEMLRLRTNKYQFVVVPDSQFLLVMVLNP